MQNIQSRWLRERRSQSDKSVVQQQVQTVVVTASESEEDLTVPATDLLTELHPSSPEPILARTSTNQTNDGATSPSSITGVEDLSPSISSAMRGLGDAVRFRVKKTWSNRGRSSSDQSKKNLSESSLEIQQPQDATGISPSDSTNLEASDISFPPHLAPRPHPGLATASSAMSLAETRTATAGEMDLNSAKDTKASTAEAGRAILFHPQSPPVLSHQNISPPGYFRAMSTLSEALANIDNQDSNSVSQIQDDRSLMLRTQSMPYPSNVVQHQQSQVAPVEAIESKQLVLAQSSKNWLTWSLAQEVPCINVGIVSYNEEDPPTCDLCDEKLVMDGPSEIKPIQSDVHVCDTCGQSRILCERCARRAINISDDPHEADHMLRRVGPRTSFSPLSLLQPKSSSSETQHNIIIPRDQLWLNSDFAFCPPAEAKSLHARFVVSPPPGTHKVAANIRVKFEASSISREAIGFAAKQWMKTTKRPLGEVTVGLEVVSAKSNDLVTTSDMPVLADTLKQPIFYRSGTYVNEYILPLTDSIKIASDQLLVLHVISTHNISIFKSGCPFSWYLDSLKLEEYGEGKMLATKGQQLKRERDIEAMKVQEKREARNRHIGYVGTAVGLGTGLAEFGGAAHGLGSAVKLLKK